jgi:hypothetical protein
MRNLVVCLALSLGACASPNLYVSARPLGPGVIQHTIAIEGLAAATPTGAAILPTAPTWQVRVGVARRFDLMARLVNLSGLGLDGLISLHEGALDVALVPGVRGAWLPFSAGRPGVLSGHLPLLLGVHLGDRTTLMVSVGGGFLATLGDSASAEATSKVLPESAEASSQGFFVRGGLGLRWRVSQGLILHPEVTMLYTPATRRTSLSGGVGFTFGALEPLK